MGLLRRPAVTLVLGVCVALLIGVPAYALADVGSGSAGSSTTSVFQPSQRTQTQVDALTAQAEQVQAELDALDQVLDEKTQEYNRCLAELQAANARMSELRRLVAEAEADKARAQAALGERIKSVYMAGGRDRLLQMLFLADGLDDLYNRVRLVSSLADQDKRLIAEVEERTTRLDLLVEGMRNQKGQELALREQLSRGSAELQALMADRERKLAGLQARAKVIIEQEYQRQLAEKTRLEQELQARLLADQAAAQNRLVNGIQVQPRGSNVLRPEQIALVAQKAGFTGDNLVIAVAVALAESSGNANAHGDVTIGGSFGLWQIYCVAHPDLIPPWDPDSVAWYDPYQNARWAYEVSGGSNWRPWSTYKHGTYLRHMATADAAVRILLGSP